MTTSIALRSLRLRRFTTGVLAAAALACLPTWATAQPLPGNTTLPVSFATTLEAGKTKVNDPVRAHTLQTVVLPDGTSLPKGTVLVGHVTASVPFHFDSTPYAVQKPSLLGIHFDSIERQDGAQPVNLAVRAIAGSAAVEEASRPFNVTEYQMNGPMIQVGGDTYWPPDAAVRTRGGQIVAYARKDGVFARPLAAEARNAGPGLACDAIPQEQAVSVFSASACGLYGMTDDVMQANGADGSGTFVLASNHTSVFILARSAALLEVLSDR